MEQRQGYVEHIIFRNTENGYTVFELACQDEDGEYLETCVGNFPFINEGEYLLLWGNITYHPTYDDQFKVTKSEVKEPEDAVAMQRYLSSGVIKGIGAGLAKRIVDMFGDRTFEIIEKEPERLAEVKGISKRKATEVYEAFEEKKDTREAFIFLQKYGISNQLAAKIYDKYKGNVYDIIQNNPYKLSEDIRGIGFKIADDIAAKIGFDVNSEFRIKAGIIYALENEISNGHIFIPEVELCKKSVEILAVPLERIIETIEKMIIDKDLIKDNEDVYLPVLYYGEMGVARMLCDLDQVAYQFDESLERMIQDSQGIDGIFLDENQLDAVRESLVKGVLVITGGPGTGKTTTINRIIKMLEAQGESILLAAPTGRAAKRLSETTNREAQTIHRLLEYNGAGLESNSDSYSNDNKGLFARNEFNKLESDVIIIDEMSMVDIFLFSSLLKAIPVGTRLILVGDVNQLPSVGPGNVLRDIIDSKIFSVVRLEQIFRQAAMSDIVVGAHDINKGRIPKLNNDSKDFFCLEQDNSHDVLGVALTLVRDKMPAYVDCTPFDVQVLTPMKKGETGLIKCNEVLQRYINPPSKSKAEMEYRDNIFRVGDKVMQTKNNYQIRWQIEGYNGIVIEDGTGIFNGDMGVVDSVDLFNKEMTVIFDDEKRVTYTMANMDELELAYAITIHKSQGSEYPAVVIPIMGGPKMLMNRNLLYTAVTRGKKCVILVGNKNAIIEMINNQNERKRYSSLKKRILEVKN
ncbi:MAG: ATP-dependent RecD-like DNA helicase [Eubacterium sp.]|nr:ATP-dependent RecD-like DNA helicase [Eubacterium sp.]